ncbi:G-protein coupled receptor 4-like [Thunnus albacares]|uniref:G-protein coupled receptor 4-like n=1 Tax=Thunnus albacares TaxID=8236 RepID=UPI001CF6CB55|nr:G-protein coupled receptor 4-like [Thunnus albacares]
MCSFIPASLKVQNNNVAPIFIINLLISDIIQFCYMIVLVAKPDGKIYEIFCYIYYYSVMASVGFMVCVALERYLGIAWPLWYHVRRSIKISFVVCVVVWTLPLVYVLPLYFWVKFEISETIFTVFLLVPFPLLIFFLGGTLKSLFAAISVSSDEKRRIVGMLVLWKVPVVHEALVIDPYEPLECSSLKALSFKTALLLALTSAMRVSELCALSVHPSCFVVTTAGLLSDRLTDFYNYQIYSF